MKIFQLIDLIIKLFKLNKRSKVVLLFLIPTFLVGQNQAFWLGKRASATGETDPFFSDVSLLLHMDGTNNSTTFTDNSINNFTVTPFGNAKISTAQSKFGGASGYFDGNGDYLSVPVSSAFAFNGDFTIEAWVYVLQLNNVGAASYVCDFRSGGSNNLTLGIINISGSGRMYVYMSGVDRVGSISIVNGTWNHIAFVRSGSSITLYLNGISNGVLSSSFSQSSTSLIIASRFTGLAEFVNGYIDDLRITKGVARYTSNFTPPTAPFPNN